MDEARTAEAIVSRGLIGRVVTRVLLDYGVTLQFWILGEPTIEVRLNTQFEIAKADGSRLTVKPGDLADAARDIAELHAQTVAEVAILVGGELRLGFEVGPTIFAPLDGEYESWQYASDDGNLVICLPSGGLAFVAPRTS